MSHAFLQCRLSVCIESKTITLSLIIYICILVTLQIPYVVQRQPIIAKILE